MLMRRSALAEVGLFDEGYWLYMEDLDLCYRFKQAGWLTWYDPSATVVHVKAGTSGERRDLRRNYAFHYGMYRFYRQHYAARRSPFTNNAVYAGIAAKLGVSVAFSALARRLGSVAETPKPSGMTTAARLSGHRTRDLSAAPRASRLREDPRPRR